MAFALVHRTYVNETAGKDFKARRPSQKERKVYRQRSTSSTSRQEDDTSDHEASDILQSWDEIMD